MVVVCVRAHKEENLMDTQPFTSIISWLLKTFKNWEFDRLSCSCKSLVTLPHPDTKNNRWTNAERGGHMIRSICIFNCGVSARLLYLKSFSFSFTLLATNCLLLFGYCLIFPSSQWNKHIRKKKQKRGQESKRTIYVFTYNKNNTATRPFYSFSLCPSTY